MDVKRIKSLTDNEVKDLIIKLLKDTGRAGMDNLVNYLENKSDFFTAPASTRFHSAVQGGLARHSLNVYFRLLDMVAMTSKNDDVFSHRSDEENKKLMDSVAIVALLHDVCKTNFYVTEMRNRKNSNGQWEQVPFYTIKDSLPFGHGEKSVYIVTGFIKLTREEAMAIRWHMGYADNDFKGGGQSVSQAFDMFPLAVLTSCADLQATYLDESMPG